MKTLQNIYLQIKLMNIKNVFHRVRVIRQNVGSVGFFSRLVQKVIVANNFLLLNNSSYNNYMKR
jgi:hypothetical protein